MIGRDVMARQMYHSVEQVANLLGLHVRTVRGYIRDGRLTATRVGRQYRITPEDLERFTGIPATSAATESPVEVSSIVQLDNIDQDQANRLSNAVTAAAVGREHDRESDRVRIQSVYDEHRSSLKLIILGAPATTANLLQMVDVLMQDGPRTN